MATPATLQESTTAITVRVLLFASYAELLGGESVELSLPAPARVADALARLRTIAGGDRLPVHLLCALNLSQVSPDAPIAEGDELALLPPLSGG